MQKQMQKTKTSSASKPCADGIYRKATREFVGYCWFGQHKGFLTRGLLKQRNCLGKECHYLQKFEDTPYWKARNEKKQLKKDRKAEERAREAREALVIEMARGWTDQYTFMDFTAAKQSAPGKLTLSYFSKWTVDLTRCADYIRRVWQCEVELHRIDPDNDLICQILRRKKGRLAQ